jgi:molecular chaperone DnaK (HSP70)
MAKRSDKSLVVGLDIGTSKIVAIVGEMQPDGQVEVIGSARTPRAGSSAAWWSTSSRPSSRSSVPSRKPN